MEQNGTTQWLTKTNIGEKDRKKNILHTRNNSKQNQIKKKTAHDHVPKDPTLQGPTLPNPKETKMINLLIPILLLILKPVRNQNTLLDKIPKNLNPITPEKTRKSFRYISKIKKKRHTNT